MEYLKCFEQDYLYQNYKNGVDFKLPNVSYVIDSDIVYYNPYYDYDDLLVNYLTIEALEDDLTASLSVNSCEYCVDGDGNWKTLPANTRTESINSGQTLSFRGNITPAEYSGIGTFTISNKCNLKGNCMSMLFGDDAYNNYSLENKDYAFYNLFHDCKYIVNVNSNFLPATTLAEHCYESMFDGCSSLVNAPELPATTIGKHCYQYMFDNCSSLITSPVLPATTMVSYCYFRMFDGCSSLINAPVLPATTLAYRCYEGMFGDCNSLINAPELPATTLAEYCYEAMFDGCSSLVNAPELPATTLAEYCYAVMFRRCSSLVNAPVLPATTLESGCYYGMFSECSSLTTAPELPATTLEYECYRYMFKNCTKLNYIKMLATDISPYNCLDEWVNNVSTTGTFVKNPDMTTLPTGVDGIPEVWTVVDAA